VQTGHELCGRRYTLPDVTLAQLRAAIALGMYAARCTEQLIDAKAENTHPDTELEQKFLKWIRAHEGARKRIMQQSLTKYTGGCEQFNRVLNNLIRADHVEVRDNRVYSAHDASG
jgi:hypothetical protein